MYRNDIEKAVEYSQQIRKKLLQDIKKAKRVSLQRQGSS